jgi:hypothetical protein
VLVVVEQLVPRGDMAPKVELADMQLELLQ